MRWNTKSIEIWNDNVRFKRDIKLRDILRKDSQFPIGNPYINNTKLRSVVDFEYNENEVNELLNIVKDFNRIIPHLHIVLRDYQEAFLNSIRYSDFELICNSRQVGMSMLLRLHILRCVMNCKNVALIFPNRHQADREKKIIIDMLSELPYYMQPPIRDINDDGIIFETCKINFTLDINGHSNTDVLIFIDAAFTVDLKDMFNRIITIRQLMIKHQQTIIQSTSNIGSYFNELFSGSKYGNFNRMIIDHKVVNRKPEWEYNIRNSIGDRQFLVEYCCCMDEKKLKRVDVLKSILNK
jgi:hypothetical protein